MCSEDDYAELQGGTRYPRHTKYTTKTGSSPCGNPCVAKVISTNRRPGPSLLKRPYHTHLRYLPAYYLPAYYLPAYYLPRSPNCVQVAVNVRSSTRLRQRPAPPLISFRLLCPSTPSPLREFNGGVTDIKCSASPAAPHLRRRST